MYKCSGSKILLLIFADLDKFRVVAMSVLHLMIAYSPLLIAFAVAFMILFPTNEAFSHFNYALIKVCRKSVYLF